MDILNFVTQEDPAADSGWIDGSRGIPSALADFPVKPQNPVFFVPSEWEPADRNMLQTVSNRLMKEHSRAYAWLAKH